jgi:hypothetical protein
MVFEYSTRFQKCISMLADAAGLFACMLVLTKLLPHASCRHEENGNRRSAELFPVPISNKQH